MHFFRRGRAIRAGGDRARVGARARARTGEGQGGADGGGEPSDLLLRLVVRGLGGQQGRDLGAIHAGEELGVQGVPLGAELAPQPAPTRGLDGPARLQRLDEAQAGGVDLLVRPDILIDGQVQHAGGGIVLVDAAPAVFAGAAAEGRQAQVVPAADGLGVQPGQVVVARLGPGFGGSDAIGLGHDAQPKGVMRQKRS